MADIQNTQQAAEAEAPIAQTPPEERLLPAADITNNLAMAAAELPKTSTVHPYQVIVEFDDKGTVLDAKLLSLTRMTREGVVLAAQVGSPQSLPPDTVMALAAILQPAVGGAEVTTVGSQESVAPTSTLGKLKNWLTGS